MTNALKAAPKHLEIMCWHTAAFTKWNRQMFNNALFFFPACFRSARLMFPFKRISILISPAEDQPPSPAWAIRHRVIGRSPHLEKRREGKRTRAFRWIKFADSVSKGVKREGMKRLRQNFRTNLEVNERDVYKKKKKVIQSLADVGSLLEVAFKPSGSVHSRASVGIT